MLVSDNSAMVADMLNVIGRNSPQDTSLVLELCEKCAGVMKQQQLSSSAFLARFFDRDCLASHSRKLKKSDKGSAPTLADRIEAEWRKNRISLASTDSTDGKDGDETDTSPEEDTHSCGRKRKVDEAASRGGEEPPKQKNPSSNNSKKSGMST
jgi:hypothetical protein